jgi:hypothetical protein
VFAPLIGLHRTADVYGAVVILGAIASLLATRLRRAADKVHRD